MNIKEAEHLIDRAANRDDIFQSDLAEAKGYLEAISQVQPLITALKALSEGPCETKGCSMVAKYALAIWREVQR